MDRIASEGEYEGVKELYKILILPERFLNEYLSGLRPDQLKRVFKKWTLLIHPDKNNHPQAKFAFQKFYSIFAQELQN